MDYLKRSYQSGQLTFPGVIGHLDHPHGFEQFRRGLYQKNWFVYCKPPFNGPQSVLKYLGRYTHRIAISNERILTLRDGKVSFLWRDYADGQKKKVMALKASEFIRRFLLHVLPDRFVKIRHFGLLANRTRKENVAVCREMLGNCTREMNNENMPETWQERLLRVSGIDVTKCPVCQKGGMFRVDVLHPTRCNGPPIQ